MCLERCRGEEMRYLIKFGEEKYLKRCINYEKFYFGRARTYINIEKNLFIKGQGDINEATLSLNCATGFFIDSYGNKRSFENKINLDILVDVAADIPTYCISEIDTDKHCIYTKDGYKLSSEFLEMIREHFPKADSAIIIKDSASFVANFNKQINCFSNSIKYFSKLEEGLTTDFVSAISSEITKEDYETSGNTNIVNFISNLNDGTTSYHTINQKNAYKILFTKNEFFSKELEYRFVLPNKQIQSDGMEYLIRGSCKYMDFVTISDLERNYFL